MGKKIVSMKKTEKDWEHHAKLLVSFSNLSYNVIIFRIFSTFFYQLNPTSFVSFICSKFCVLIVFFFFLAFQNASSAP